jgi:hypothetical protein
MCIDADPLDTRRLGALARKGEAPIVFPAGGYGGGTPPVRSLA